MWNPTLQISDRDLLLLLSYINILILFIQALYLSETESLLYHQEMQFFFHSYVWKRSFTSALKCTCVQAALIGCTCTIAQWLHLKYTWPINKSFLKKGLDSCTAELANSSGSKSLKCTTKERNPTIAVLVHKGVWTQTSLSEETV